MPKPDVPCKTFMVSKFAIGGFPSSQGVGVEGVGAQGAITRIFDIAIAPAVESNLPSSIPPVAMLIAPGLEIRVPFICVEAPIDIAPADIQNTLQD